MNTRLTQNGFTLVETLVAIAVLLLVIIGPMTVAQRGIQNAYFAKEQMTATFLAQEAIEAVREKRDEVALSVYNEDTTSTDSWAPSCTSGCAYDVVNNEFESCTSQYNNGCRLKINGDGNYNHEGGGADSPFTRTVTIGPVVNGNAPVVVDVAWEGRIFGTGTVRHVVLQTWVYDHYQRFEP